MKLTSVIMIVAFLQVSAKSYSQKINLNETNSPLNEVLQSISKQTGYGFFYESKDVQNKNVTIQVKGASLSEALGECLKQLPLEFRIVNNTVIIKEKSPPLKANPDVNKLTAPAAVASIQVTGSVYDNDNKPLPGVTIRLKGGPAVAVTDMDGKFKIQVPDKNAVLIFSSLSFVTKEMKVVIGSEMVVHLANDVSKLDEIVVVGYGSQKRKDVIGAVSSVNTKNLSKLTGGDVSNLLQGQAAGVNAAPASADPGARPLIRVRGLSTIGDNEPLYIIDGIPGDIAAINPIDIQSIDVLKDASAATIYGSRASNGVIIITTKRGREGKILVTLSSYYGSNSLAKKISVANSQQYDTIIKQAFDNDGTSPYPDYVASNTYVDANGRTQNYPNTDWQNAFFRTAPESKLDFGISGGTKDLRMNVSFGKYSQEGIAINTRYDKYNLQVNTDMTKDKFKFGESFTYSFGKRNILWSNSESTANGQNAGFPALYYPIIAVPQRAIYDPNNDGGYSSRIGTQMPDDYNPVGIQQLTTNYSTNSTMLANVFGEYQIITPLSFKLQYGVNVMDGYSYYHEPTFFMGNNANNPTATLSEARDQTFHNVLNAFFTYNQVFNKVHSLNAIAGYSQETNQYKSLTGSNSDLPSNILLSLGSGIGNQASGGSLLESALRSYFGRVNYSYNGKYLLGASVRRDGSSRFSNLNRYGTFYSGTAAWRISDEEFFKKNISLINDFKLRGSYGILGNQSIPDYLYLPPPVSTNDPNNGVNINYPFGPGLRQAIATGNIITTASSPNIQWEQSATANLGFDMSLLKDKISVIFDVFKTKTSKMLIRQPLPPSSGLLSNPLTNAGELENKGMDIATTYRSNNAGAVKFDITGNFTMNRNKVLKLGTANEYYLDGYLDYNNFPTTRTEVGHSIGEFYVYKTNGVIKTDQQLADARKLQPNAQKGDLMFVDVNKDGYLNDADRVYAGSGLPKFEYGLTSNIYYKNFDLNIFIQGTLGNKMYNGIKRLLYTNGPWNKSTDLLNAWTSQNSNSNIPRNSYTDPNGNFSVPSDIFLENGSYLRLKSVQLGYTPKLKGFNTIRLYVGANNVFTITKYTGFDPGVVNYSSFARGVDRGLYPLSRSIYAGLSLNF